MSEYLLELIRGAESHGRVVACMTIPHDWFLQLMRELGATANSGLNFVVYRGVTIYCGLNGFSMEFLWHLPRAERIAK